MYEMARSATGAQERAHLGDDRVGWGEGLCMAAVDRGGSNRLTGGSFDVHVVKDLASPPVGERLDRGGGFHTIGSRCVATAQAEIEPRSLRDCDVGFHVIGERERESVPVGRPVAAQASLMSLLDGCPSRAPSRVAS